jgi:hypothetical protein
VRRRPGSPHRSSREPAKQPTIRSWYWRFCTARLAEPEAGRATFEQTRRGRPFATRQRQHLPDDPGLAAQLPAKHSGEYRTDELLAPGCNAGPGNMKAFARDTAPGAQARTSPADLRANWAKAGTAVGNP